MEGISNTSITVIPTFLINQVMLFPLIAQLITNRSIKAANII